MGLFPGLLFGAPPAPPATAGDANAWDLASIVDVPTGVTVGDYGVLDDRVYEYASLTVDAGAGGGTQLLWVPPDVAAWTSPTVYAYLNGDEDATARANQGWTDSTSGTASITGDVSGTGWTRLQAETSSAVAAIQTLSSAVASGAKVYVRTLATGQSESGASVGWFCADGSKAMRLYDADDGLAFRANSATVINPSTVRDGGIKLADAPSGALWETVDEGQTVWAQAYRDGAAYHGTQRSNGTSTANRLEFRAFRFTGSTRIPTLDVKNLIVVTGT
ncbi:MAG: hypothetical protein ACO3N4_01435 [Ilumatobacteraceae bacterium]